MAAHAAGRQRRAVRLERRPAGRRRAVHAVVRGADPRRSERPELHQPRRRLRDLGRDDEARPAASRRLDALPAQREPGEAVPRVEPLPRHLQGRRAQAGGQRQGGLGRQPVRPAQGLHLPGVRGLGMPLPQPPDQGAARDRRDPGRDGDARRGLRLALLGARPARLEVGPGPRGPLAGQGLRSSTTTARARPRTRTSGPRRTTATSC